jgi:hypothetical protein
MRGYFDVKSNVEWIKSKNRMRFLVIALALNENR